MTRSLCILAAVFGVLLMTSRCLAADPALGSGLEYTAPTTPPPPNPAGLIFRLVGLTAGLLALCGVVLWVARRTSRRAVVKGDGGGRLKHEGTLVLDRRCAVHLIRVDGQTVAVTTDATGLRSIAILSEPFEVALASATAPETGTARAA